jgi:hypothetical protein
MINDPNYTGDLQEFTPEELHQTLVGFLGQTYSEVSKYDKNIVSSNAFLAPKKNEFEQVAQKVMNEVGATVAPNNTQNRPQQPPQNVVQNQNRPFIDFDHRPLQNTDPNQMEFSFDNSVTAITINTKLEDIEKRLKKLDNVMAKVLSLLESNETKNSK